MGKGEEEQPVGTSLDAQSTYQYAEDRCRGCSRLKGLLSFKCVFVLLLGMGVLLSAIFLLPLFKNGDLRYLDLDNKYKGQGNFIDIQQQVYAGEHRHLAIEQLNYQTGHDIVASFMLEPVPFVKDYIVQLADDIFDEISVSNTKVEIISLENIAGPNITEVVFAVDSAVKNIRVSLTALSLVRSEFETVLTGQSALHLTASLFGDPFSFDVLKFRGGITVSPKQSGFLMQQVQILFNFTLNFSIDEIQDNFHELTSQLKSGLHLSSYENLYISLTNTRGSTVDPPTIVQCKVLYAVGINSTRSRLKQLSQTIGSHSDNLGLNNTVFGRVKQVSLSSFLPHSRGGDSGSPSPSPAPLPHHHHHHNRDSNLAPAISPAPRVEKGGSISRKVSPVPVPAPASVKVLAPAPTPAKPKSPEAQPPCHFGRYPRKAKGRPHMVPARAPVHAPHITPSPHRQIHAPTPMPHGLAASSPLPNVVYAHVQPLPKSNSVAEPPNRFTSASPLPSSSSKGIHSSKFWSLLLFLLVLHP
ncbi:uncharacterized protein [Nicotiana sylvestris]|uniref:Uncharacterized protein LOC104245195 isoform X1 n=1 Tax=Nicotiana sylvestris TaxID=4096 RepID=A0A1U7YJR9_NICSY|nr:PREDICTED: uncharacterized protein LOC104245195 isoform X1 [Nicotiana sylvestris]XP_016505483.1 PREDICTED: uncharacterized protein LOC107823363 isoform X1 [Nicotiana tabacum]